MPEATPLGTGLSRRVDRQFSEAALAATDYEVVELRRLHRAKEAGEIPMPVVSEILRGLLRTQNERAGARAA